MTIIISAIGEYYDLNAGINNLFAGLAFFGIVATLFLQYQELKQQSAELKKLRFKEILSYQPQLQVTEYRNSALDSIGDRADWCQHVARMDFTIVGGKIFNELSITIKQTKFEFAYGYGQKGGSHIHYTIENGILSIIPKDEYNLDKPSKKLRCYVQSDRKPIDDTFTLECSYFDQYNTARTQLILVYCNHGRSSIIKFDSNEFPSH